jgi:hypothetical protein
MDFKLTSLDKKILIALLKLVFLAFLYGVLLRDLIKDASVEFQTGVNLFYIILIVFLIFDFKQMKAGKIILRK